MLRTPTELEIQFANLWDSLYPNIDLYTEYRFDTKRKYLFDFANLDAKVAIEIQGGIYQPNQGHNSIAGIKRDCKKFCLAASQGWLVFPLTEDMITEEWLDVIARVINNRTSNQNTKVL